MEDWAKVFNQAATNLANAADANEGQDRTNNIRIAARWYLGLPQLIFRDTDGRKERKHARIRMRLTAFLQGDFDTPLGHWVCGRNKALRKDRKPKSDMKEHRVQQGIKLIIQDFVRRGLRLVEGNGKAPAKAVFGKMIDKHPQHEKSWVPPVRPTDRSDDPALLSLRTVALAVDPKAGVGLHGFQSHYARKLAVGSFSDPEANSAFAAFTRLGVIYLNTQMPPWLRRLLGSGLLTPLAKNQEPARPKG